MNIFGIIGAALKVFVETRAKRNYPWLDKVHPDMRRMVLDAEKRGFAAASYDAERGEVRLEFKSTGAWDSCAEVYNAASGEMVMKARS